jgi:CheY-like chemotaxis protein
VSNLHNNACKFAGHEGKISLSANLNEDDVVISVRDNGIGIPPEKLLYIFEMFSQVDQSLERSHGGLGIGLTLARRLVELHGGSIEARSDGIGKGSEFVVRLPATIDRAAVPTEKPNDEITSSNKRLILVVDDNQDSANSLAMLLKQTGNQTLVAYDGEGAVEAAALERPDVILLDIGLPKLNGFDACRRIRKYPWAKNVLIFALTGWGQEDDRRKSAEAGFDGHLVKPVDHAELTRLLAGHSPQEKTQVAQSL